MPYHAGTFAKQSKSDIAAMLKAVGAEILQRMPTEARRASASTPASGAKAGAAADATATNTTTTTTAGADGSVERGAAEEAVGGEGPAGTSSQLLSAAKSQGYGLTGVVPKAGLVMVDAEAPGMAKKPGQPHKMAAAAEAAGMGLVSYKWLLDCLGSYRVVPLEGHSLL